VSAAGGTDLVIVVGMEQKTIRKSAHEGMGILITEDVWYKPGSPEAARKRFFIETEEYRWEVEVWRREVKETGTPVYYALADAGHSAYGLTVHEALNDLAGIMAQRVKAYPGGPKAIPFQDLRSYLHPRDAAFESEKISGLLTGKSFLARLFGL
jgi:hypothetical protein